jgi:transcriptional regulator with XRE-family HTH domain
MAGGDAPGPEAARAELGAGLWVRRTAAGLSQMRLSELTGCSTATVGSAERGEKVPGRWFWEAADVRLDAGGVLLAMFDAFDAGRGRGVSAVRSGGAPLSDLSPYRSLWHYLGAELRVWRLRRGLSQAGLGARVHASEALVQKVEVGTRTPTVDLVRACDTELDTGGVLSRLHALAVADPFGGQRPAPVDGVPAPGGVPVAGGGPVTVVVHVVPGGEQVDGGGWPVPAGSGSAGAAVVRLADHRRRPGGGWAG